MIRRLLLAAGLVVAALGATRAYAEKLVLGDAHGEPDVVDEATAFGFLVKSAFAKDERTLVGPVPAGLTTGTAAAAIAQLHADHAILIEVSREGTSLRATLAVIDPDGGLIITHVNAGDGDVARLANLAVAKISAITHAEANSVPAIAMGRLRPFAVALRTGDPSVLVDALPTTALAVPPIGPALAKLPPTALGARALASRAQLDALPPEDVAAHAFAALDRAEVTAAEALLGKPTKNEPGLIILARALIADNRNDVPTVQKLMLLGLASDQPRAMLAFASSLPGTRFTPKLLETVLAAVDAAGATAGVVSRLGLLGAEAQLPGALDLIAVRELDDAELSRLIPLIEVEPDPTIIRLRAEVSIRRADGHQEKAIGAFLAASPNDVRAHLDHGFELMAIGRPADAVAEFDTAGNERLKTRALFVSNQLAEALKQIEKPTSAEELAIAALGAKRGEDAMALAERADKLGPVNPLVQRVVALIADRNKDPARAKLARQIADEGRAPAFTLGAQNAAPAPASVPTPAATGNAPSAPAMSSASPPDDGGGPPVIPLAIASLVFVGGIVAVVVLRRRRPKFVPLPVLAEVPLEQLVIEAPPAPDEPEAEPFADFPFAITPIPPTAPPAPDALDPQAPLDLLAPLDLPPEDDGELSFAPEPEELMFADQIPHEQVAVSFRKSETAMPVVARALTPMPMQAMQPGPAIGRTPTPMPMRPAPAPYAPPQPQPQMQAPYPMPAMGRTPTPMPMRTPPQAVAMMAAPAEPLLDLFEAPVESMPGLVLDRYRTTRELGRGAMGVVYRAWDTNLEREVAIKVMAEELRSNPQAMQLFTQEAKSLAQLNHANIVTVYDQITVAQKVYMIMEFVDGETLEETIARRKLFPWQEAIALVDQLCAGLAYAHARKVIHRDIKPANIFVSKDGSIKLGDFGLARVMREIAIRRTEVRGTPLYMAPEQVTGTDIDHRTDLYAMGCTLYELVTGRPPFVDGDILYQQVHGVPMAPSQFVQLPPVLEQLIMRLLAKNVVDRPASAGEVRAVLKSIS